MTYDLIILSYAKTPEHKKITQDCIKSIVNAENRVHINIFVLESFDKNIQYRGATTIFFKEEEFNYNRSMNYGFSLTSAPYVFFCNNDLIFSDGWADNCYYGFRMGYDSVSPYCPVTHPQFCNRGDFIIPGYQVGFHVAGWCIGVERKTFERIGGFNTAVSFWYSDNIYAEQMKLENVKHCLVCNALVKHLDFGSKTLLTMTDREKARLTNLQEVRYRKEVKRLKNAKEKEVLRKST